MKMARHYTHNQPGMKIYFLNSGSDSWITGMTITLNAPLLPY